MAGNFWDVIDIARELKPGWAAWCIDTFKKEGTPYDFFKKSHSAELTNLVRELDEAELDSHLAAFLFFAAISDKDLRESTDRYFKKYAHEKSSTIRVDWLREAQIYDSLHHEEEPLEKKLERIENFFRDED